MEADVTIIGSGPAGLQAAIYAARKNVAVVLVGKISGSAAYGTRVENYFGLPGPFSGTDLLMNGIRQARSFGAEIIDTNVISAEKTKTGFKVTIESGMVVNSKAVILATGVSRVKLGVPGEKEFSSGKGVSYCAVCDCNFYKGKRVAIVGGQSEAAISAEMMTKYASDTYWIYPEFDADKVLIGKAVAAGVHVVESAVKEIRGTDKVSSVLLGNGTELPLDGVFIELGGRSSVDMAMDMGLMPEMDDTVKIDSGCATSVPGLFACGDVAGKPWQIAKAVGDGAVAGLSAAAYVGAKK